MGHYDDCIYGNCGVCGQAEVVGLNSKCDGKGSLLCPYIKNRSKEIIENKIKEIKIYI